jgi:hypothetical protein
MGAPILAGPPLCHGPPFLRWRTTILEAPRDRATSARSALLIAADMLEGILDVRSEERPTQFVQAPQQIGELRVATKFLEILPCAVTSAATYAHEQIFRAHQADDGLSHWLNL